MKRFLGLSLSFLFLFFAKATEPTLAERLVQEAAKGEASLPEIDGEARTVFLEEMMDLAEMNRWMNTHLRDDQLNLVYWLLENMRDIEGKTDLLRYLPGDRETFDALPAQAIEDNSKRFLYALSSVDGLYGRSPSPAITLWLETKPGVDEMSELLDLAIRHRRLDDQRTIASELRNRIPTSKEAAAWEIRYLWRARRGDRAIDTWKTHRDDSAIMQEARYYLISQMRRMRRSMDGFARAEYLTELFSGADPSLQLGEAYGGILGEKAKFLWDNGKRNEAFAIVDKMVKDIAAYEGRLEGDSPLDVASIRFTPTGSELFTRYQSALESAYAQNLENANLQRALIAHYA